MTSVPVQESNNLHGPNSSFQYQSQNIVYRRFVQNSSWYLFDDINADLTHIKVNNQSWEFRLLLSRGTRS